MKKIDIVRENIKERHIYYQIKELAGAVKFTKIKFLEHIGATDSWLELAVCDYLIELAEIKEITNDVDGQDRVYVRA